MVHASRPAAFLKPPPPTNAESDTDISGIKYQDEQIFSFIHFGVFRYAENVLNIFGNIFFERDFYFLLMTCTLRYWHNEPITVRESYDIMGRKEGTGKDRLRSAIERDLIRLSVHPRDSRCRIIEPTDRLQKMVRKANSEGIDAFRYALERASHYGPMPPISADEP